MHCDWVLPLKGQCRRAKVPFFFKQWGGVHKSKFGRILDGRTYDAMPKRSVAMNVRRRFKSQPAIGSRLSL